MLKFVIVFLIPALFSAILYTLSQPKFNIWFLSLFFVLPLHVIWRRRGSIKVFFLAGFLTFFFTVHWITHAITYYGGFPYLFAILPLALLSFALGMFHLFFGLIRSKISKLGIPFSIIDPPVWVTMEFMKTFVFTGFPWALVGYSLWQNPSLIQISDITGVYGVSFLVMILNGFFCDLADLLMLRSRISLKKIISSLIFTLSAIVLVVAYSRFREAEIVSLMEDLKEFPAIVVQPNIPQDIKWSYYLKEKFFSDNISLTFSALDSNYENVLVIWPETALTFFIEKEKEFADRLIDMAHKGFYIVAGGLGFSSDNGKIKYYNRAFFITPAGKIYSYDKTHLVMFGEYIPLRNYLEKIPFIKKMIDEIEKVAGDFEPGKEIKALGDKGDINIAVPICFESIFPYLVRKMGKHANIVAVITNDTWFGRSSGPHQHFSASVFRAVELRRFVLRSANSGISGAIDPLGRILAKTQLDQKTSFIVKVKFLDIQTFYSKFGDIFSVVCVLVTLGLFLFATSYRSYALSGNSKKISIKKISI